MDKKDVAAVGTLAIVGSALTLAFYGGLIYFAVRVVSCAWGA